VEVQSVTPALAAQLGLPGGTSGAAVAGVVPGGPASSAGLRQGDVIQGVGGATVSDDSGLTRALAGHSPGDKVSVRVLRPGGGTSIDVTLGQRPVSLEG
jgi:S1-C subfamily serine protease